eukprot:GFYU01002354.1.p1 GENE.GFYU01002354.1~~GFYU01002354.1.p1  ORF type:complete len:265 (-),score=54.21 GFYU01002354.1:386-1180(-)
MLSTRLSQRALLSVAVVLALLATATALRTYSGARVKAKAEAMAQSKEGPIEIGSTAIQTATTSSHLSTVHWQPGVSGNGNGVPPDRQIDPLEPDCQWELFLHDDFVQGATAWSNPETMRCGGNMVLAGYDSVPENRPLGDVFTHVSAIPEHTHIRVKANFYFLDSWDNEYAFLKLDDRVVWNRDCYGCYKKGQNFCGAHWPDQLAEAIDVIIPHRRNNLKIAFGSNLDEDTRSESYAIGNFMIYYFDCEDQPTDTSNRRETGWV